MHSNVTTNKNASSSPPLLKINKDSHPINKSSSSILSSLPPPHRTPLIIYTHSPKIIHTHPKDFMALVQKLTGMSRSYVDNHQVKRESPDDHDNNKNVKMCGNNDDESCSVITTEEKCAGDIGQVNSSSCFMPPIFDPPNPYITKMPVFTPNSADFFCGNQSYYNNDSFYFNKPNMRTAISVSSLEGMNDFPEY